MAKTAVPANDMKMAPSTAEPRVQECQIAGLGIRHERTPSCYDVTVTVDRDGGTLPNPADFAVIAERAV